MTVKLTILDSGPEKNELNKNSMGGTELMQNRLHKEMPKELMEQFQIICSRARRIKDDKKVILWCHDLALDPEVEHLKDGGHKKFDNSFLYLIGNCKNTLLIWAFLILLALYYRMLLIRSQNIRNLMM